MTSTHTEILPVISEMPAVGAEMSSATPDQSSVITEILSVTSEMPAINSEMPSAMSD